jgi:Flp pilus assembly protein TadB
MLAESFWTGTAVQIVLAVLVGLVAFFLAWFLLGNAARMKKDREIEARMRSVLQPGQQPVATGAAATTPGTGWIPDQVTRFGTRFAEARGFSDSLDAQLEAAGVSLRSGEFVIASVGAALVGGILGAALLGNFLLALVIAGVAALVPTALLRSALSKRADKLREQTS